MSGLDYIPTQAILDCMNNIDSEDYFYIPGTKCRSIMYHIMYHMQFPQTDTTLPTLLCVCSDDHEREKMIVIMLNSFVAFPVANLMWSKTALAGLVTLSPSSSSSSSSSSSKFSEIQFTTAAYMANGPSYFMYNKDKIFFTTTPFSMTSPDFEHMMEECRTVLLSHRNPKEDFIGVPHLRKI